jgi:hypothetical protein
MFMGVICFHHKAFSGPWPAKVLQGLTIRQQHSDCGVFVCWGARIIFSGQAIPLIEDGGLITHSTRIGGCWGSGCRPRCASTYGTAPPSLSSEKLSFQSKYFSSCWRILDRRKGLSDDYILHWLRFLTASSQL